MTDSTHLDQSYKRLSTAELQQQETRFRLFIEAVKDYAIYVLDPEGRVNSWNEGAQRIKGYPSEEILGQHFSRFYPPEEVAAGKPQRQLEIAAREGKVEDEGWRMRKDGSRFWANAVITAIRDGQGRLAGFVKVTRDFTEKMRAQEALQEANTRLAAEVAERKLAEQRLALSEKSLRELSLHLLRTQDEERKRIGRDLHDSLGQYLAVLKINLESLASTLNSHNDAATREVQRCIALADDSVRELRTISYLLYPPLLEEMGLKAAIPWYLEGFSKRSGLQTAFEVDPQLDRLDTQVELALFRVLQESLTNVHRHSGSARALVRLYPAGDEAVLQVEDYGKGIPAGVLERTGPDWMGSPGVGLRGMNERMRQLGGRLTVSSNKEGTLLTAAVPIGSDH